MDQRVKARTGGLYLVLKTLKLSGESFQLSFQFSDGLFRRFTCNRNTCELRSDQLLVREIFASALDEVGRHSGRNHCVAVSQHVK